MLCIRFATHGKDSIPALHITRPYICGISAPYSPFTARSFYFDCAMHGENPKWSKSRAHVLFCVHYALCRRIRHSFDDATLYLLGTRFHCAAIVPDCMAGRWGGAEERESNCNANIIRKLVAALQWINTAFQANFNICLSVACLFVFVWCFSLCLCVCLIFFQLKLS